MNKASKSELSILVVDDDENIRLVLSKALEKEGYRVSTAKSGEEALSILQRSFFHVVISDIMLGPAVSTTWRHRPTVLSMSGAKR